jgi:hypothetical protein
MKAISKMNFDAFIVPCKREEDEESVEEEHGVCSGAWPLRHQPSHAAKAPGKGRIPVYVGDKGLGETGGKDGTDCMGVIKCNDATELVDEDGLEYDPDSIRRLAKPHDQEHSRRKIGSRANTPPLPRRHLNNPQSARKTCSSCTIS